ncbi:MAG: hypothetical protein Tsb0021_12980 [Chlamydiales bacterium]
MANIKENETIPVRRRSTSWLLDPFFEGFYPFSRQPEGNITTNLSISEDDERIYVEAALPGLKENEIDVSYENGVLTIHGHKNEETEDKNRTYYRRAATTFSYSCSLPREVDENVEPKANLKDGVLHIQFTKFQKQKPKKISINRG